MRSATAVVMSDSELGEVMVEVPPGKTGPGFPGHRSKVGVLRPDATGVGQEPGQQGFEPGAVGLPVGGRTLKQLGRPLYPAPEPGEPVYNEKLDHRPVQDVPPRRDHDVAQGHPELVGEMHHHPRCGERAPARRCVAAETPEPGEDLPVAGWVEQGLHDSAFPPDGR